MKRNHPTGAPLPEASPAEVLQVITSATSQDPAKMKTSSERLKELLDMTGTYDALSEISVSQNVPLPVRQQAIIQLKNNVTNFWRSRKLALLGFTLLYLLTLLQDSFQSSVCASKNVVFDSLTNQMT